MDIESEVTDNVISKELFIIDKDLCEVVDK